MVKVELNQEVVVTDGAGRAKALVYRGTVAKIGRIWIDVHRDGRLRWRFRLDTQTDGGTFGYSPRFYTLEQWAENQLKVGAREYLREQGIHVQHHSSWRDREVELARLTGWSPPPPA